MLVVGLAEMKTLFVIIVTPRSLVEIYLDNANRYAGNLLPGAIDDGGSKLREIFAPSVNIEFVNRRLHVARVDRPALVIADDDVCLEDNHTTCSLSLLIARISHKSI